MNVSLVMFKADGSRRDFSVVKPRIIVGRTNACDLRIPLSSVSRQHCEFRLEGSSFKLRDLGSSNGTFRNNTRIASETLLQPGDEIVIGPVVFTVVIDGKPAHIDPVRTVLDRNRASTGGGSQSDGPQIVEPQRHSFETGVAMPSVSPKPAIRDNDPTLDLDDPIAALEAMAAGSDATQIPAANPVSAGLDDEDDDFIPMLDDEDEDDKPILADKDDDEDDDAFPTRDDDIDIVLLDDDDDDK